MSVRRRLQRLLCLMGRRPELLCGALALSCGLLLVLRITCSRAKDVIMPPRPPVHFFSTRSPVVDLFRGQLDYAEHIRQDSEVTMFFLYAPWCGQSIAARAEIEQVANRLADQVLFVAVNCWWHQGKCRKQKSFFYFPVINLYHKSFGPIEYKGPMTAAYIEKFVRRVMTPLLYIPSLPRLQDFLSHYEPGVLGYFEFNASPQPPGYLTFLSSALHSLQKDYVGTIRFGVITDRKLAKELSLTNPGSVYLHRNINSSLVYPDKEMNFTAVNICKWALDNRETLLRWLRPHGGKSLLLQNELKKGPALFMFLPFNPLAENQPLLHEITEMTIRYNRCTQSQNAQEGKAMQPVDTKPSSDSSSHHTVTHKTFSCCNTVVLPQWHLISMFHNVCELCVNQTAGIKPSKVSAPRCNFLVIQAALDSFYLKEQFFLGFRSAVRECSNFLSFYSPFNHYTACCQTVKRGIITSNTGHTTTQSVRASDLGLYKEEAPRLLPHIEEQILEPPTHHHHHISSNGIDGLRCRTNKTLNLYLLDSNLSWLYAERLGASRSSWDRSFAAIVDVKEEIHYVLDQSQPLIRPNIEAFIQNFSRLYSPLRRHLVGESPPRHSKQHLITEVTSATFYHVVLESKKDVLLLYYTVWCGFCAALNHIFIRLAQLLATDSLIVARINVAQNDLPWEFMADHIPTIIFFPQNRKANSVKYPDAQPITLPKLLRFILKHASLPPAAEPPPSCPGHYLSYKANHVSLLEREIQRLRAEIEVLHRAQEQLAGHIAEARRDKQDLKAQKQMLEEHNKALEIHKGQFQALYEERTREVGSMADKLKELAAASQSLLAENTMLRFIMASMEDKGRTKPDPEGTPTPEDGTPTPEDGIRPVLGSTEHSDSSPAEASLTLDQARENQTD